LNLAEKSELTGFLRKHGLKADKSLGQHFLCCPEVVFGIIDAAKPFSGCLEIGPGPGILTSYLDQEATKMVAIEFDPRMVKPLSYAAPTCEVLLADALKVDLESVLKMLPEPRALVSNMPYYITGPLLEKFATARHVFDVAVLMMQKEVGVKIAAPPGQRERGSLSVNLQTDFEITSIIEAPGSCFMPPPKVDSIVLKLVPRVNEVSPAFRKIVRGAFVQARKTLLNNLGTYLKRERGEVLAVILESGLIETSRAFELNETQWKTLTGIIEARGWI
jgi:16S rRNA (adenine1518-N6/adenine1519-N6)-dimethyltransferase